MTRATRCPAPELIVAARAGTLSTSLQHAVDAHVAQCEVCRTLGDALADDALTNLTPEESGRIRDRVHAGLAQSSRDLVRQRIWKAASAIVVVGLAAGTWMIVSSRRVEPTPGLPPGSDRPGAGRTTNAPLQPAQGPTHLHGVVTDAGGNPLAGARVSEYTTRYSSEMAVASRTRLAATTGSDGRYSIFGVPLGPAPALVVRASKPGYFTAVAAPRKAPDVQANLTLYSWTAPLAPGQTVRASAEVQPACGGPDACRQFVIAIPRDGVFEASVTTALRDAVDLWVETPDGNIVSPRSTGLLVVTVPVTAGATLQVRVESNRGPIPFELTTRLR